MHPLNRTAPGTSPRGTVAKIRPARPEDAAAVLSLLQAEEHLEALFESSEFWVAESDEGVVACARLKPLDATSAELASVAVTSTERRRRLGSTLVSSILVNAPPTVYALALAPAFFERLGFAPIPETRLPPVLLGKAHGMCKSTGFVPMALQPRKTP